MLHVVKVKDCEIVLKRKKTEKIHRFLNLAPTKCCPSEMPHKSYKS